MDWEKVLAHANGGLGTLISRSKLKKFNFTKIDKSPVSKRHMLLPILICWKKKNRKR